MSVAQTLSICIPTRNRSGLLRATLEHLLQLSNLVHEIVISDNASTDDTESVVAPYVAKFPHVRYVRQQSNIGMIANATACLVQATSDLVYILCDDDRLVPGGIGAAVAELAGDPELVAVYGGYHEWNVKTDTIVASLLPVKTPMRCKREQAVELFKMASMILFFPVMRREVFQRFCFFDHRLMGNWTLVGQLTKKGPIKIIPEYFYQHAHTEPRAEYQLTENWYHDSYRSDFELFLAETVPSVGSDLIALLDNRSAQAYLQGCRFGGIKNEAMTERHFLLRAKTHGLVDEETLYQWELQRLFAAAMEKLAEKIAYASGVRRLVVENGPMSIFKPVAERIGELLPAVEVVPVEREVFLQLSDAPGDFFLAETWGDLNNLRRNSPGHCVAMADMLESLRITSRMPG